ncbi:NAD(P)H-dependent oxidoreductase [Nocardiopsis rhodophaea]|uniref:NAD(P)H-dependent oxidoreductase n=1 Tax=Nocardiopsis rhodophaea TaxID=280238 RepID=UPI0031D7FCCD
MTEDTTGGLVTTAEGDVRGDLRVVLVGGSTADPSHTRALLAAAVQAVEREGAEPVVWDIGRHPLPPMGTDRRAGADLCRSVDDAAAVVVVTPLYHGSYSGLVKNALDYLEEGHLRGRPVGLMSTTGRAPSAQAVDHLRVVVGEMGGMVVPGQVIATARDFTRVGTELELTDPKLGHGVGELVGELLWVAERLGGVGRSERAGLGGRAADRPESAARPVSGAQSEAVNRAVAYIRAHYREGTLTLDEVAQHVRMSRYHFSRTFRAQTGRRFMDFVAMLRLSDARVLLADTDQPVVDVCLAVGYKDLSNFERTFKRWFKVSPSRYRAACSRGRERRAPVPR